MLDLSVWRVQSVRGMAFAVPVWMQSRPFQWLAHLLASLSQSMSKKAANGSFLLTCLSLALLFNTTELLANQLTVNLLDAQSGQGIANTRVYAYELHDDGSKTRVGRQDTDESGQIIFDFDSLSSNANYFLTAKAFSNFTSKSAVFSGLSEVDFALGSISVSLIDGTVSVAAGDAPSPLSNTRVSIIGVDNEDKKHWLASATSDENGIIRIDLPADMQGQGIMIKADSPLNGHDKYSQLISEQGSYQFVAGNPAFLITVLDDATEQVMPDTRVTAYRVNDDGSKSWYARYQTDDTGAAVFDLDDIQTGAEYVFRAKVYNNVTVQSVPVTEAGAMQLRMGSTRIALVNGASEDLLPLTNTRTTIYRLDELGEKRYHLRADSDDSGMLRLNLHNIDQGTQYVLAAKSTVSGKTKYSQLLTRSGDHQVAVGNRPLNVTLADFHRDQVFTDTRIDVYRVDSDNEKVWVAKGYTNDVGTVAFDLEPIDENASYQLRSKVYNNRYSYSELLGDSGDFSFNVGSTVIAVIDGTTANNGPLVDHQVKFYAVKADGSKEYLTRLTSDDDGMVRIDLPRLAAGTDVVDFLATAQSATDSRIDYHSYLEINEVNQLVVGSVPVMVSLTDAVTGALIADKRIDVYEVYADGSDDWFTRTNTDAAGLAVLDLPGLSLGRTYRLRSKAFDDGYFYSSIVDSAGAFNFAVGNTHLTLKNGADASLAIMPNTRVTLYRVNGEDSTWVQSATTDDNGVARFDIVGAGQGYRFKASSTVNGQSKYSAVFTQDMLTQNGAIDFVMGNPSLNARLFNLVSGERYVGQQVTAYRVDSTGGYHWHSRYNTDENGEVSFDLDGIGEGEQYRLKTSVFGSGSSYSEMITAYGDVEFGIGAVPVTLIDRETQNVIAGKRIYAYELHSNGELEWMRSGRTDENGLETFDLPALGTGSRYVFKAKSPFDEGKSYYGPVITHVGPVDFYVKKGEFGEIDTQAPTISIDSPNDIANSGGFVVAGGFDDNVGVGMVELSVMDSVTGTHTLVAQIDESSHSWFAQVNPQWLTIGENIIVTATAYDFALNVNEVSRHLLVSADLANPTISISSHNANDSVNVNGFILLGTVGDDIGVQSITASLTDSNLGQTVVNQPLTIASGTSAEQWAFGVTSNLISDGGQVLVQLNATDVNGKTTTLDINLNATAIDTNPWQLAERITFGLTTDLISEVKAGNDILAEQLDPQNIDDSAFEVQMAQMPVTTTEQLQDYLLMHMIGSKKQLNEVMAWFWENHFNTNINTHQQVSYELAENQQFRLHALGNFRTLLEVSAKSPAMIRYLNNQQNVAGAANENYAREIMELHTLGVDGGYDGDDVAELARIFTGWHELDGQFAFNDELHDSGDKVFLGENIVGSGVAEGEQVLDILASHPSTASFICSKLVTLFVSDTPVANLQNQCAAEFIASSGDIRSVLLVILQSETFNDPIHYRNKVKTPLELTVATARGFSSDVNVRRINELLDDMGMDLFRYPVPTGFSEYASDWINSNALLQRMSLVNHAAWQSDDGYLIDMVDLVTSQGFTTAEGAVSLLFELALAGEYSQLEYQMAIDILHADEAFDLNQPNAAEKLQRLLATVLSFPAFQYQ